MARHIFSILCSKVSIDELDKKVSLLDIPERVLMQEPPERVEELEKLLAQARSQGKEILVPVSFQMLSVWVRSEYGTPEEAQGRVRIKPPTGKAPAPVEFSIDLSKATKYRQRIQFPQFPFRGFGLYWLTVELKSGKRWRKMSEQPLEFAVGDAGPEVLVEE